jgi:hypothetical protein
MGITRKAARFGQTKSQGGTRFGRLGQLDWLAPFQRLGQRADTG